MANVFAIAIISLVAVALGRVLHWIVRDKQIRATHLSTVRAIRWWMFPTAVLQLTLVFGFMLALAELVPALWWGWWRLLGGEGNALLGQSGQPGIAWSIVAVVVPAAVAPAIPVLAHNEELAFRLDSEGESLPAGVMRQLKFGLLHSVFAGVPIAAGLALTISGLYFRLLYLIALRRHPPSPNIADQSVLQVNPLPPLPAGSPYDSAEWDRVMKVRNEIRGHTARARILDADDTAMTGPQQAAVLTAAAAHTVSNWLICALLLGLLLTDFVT